MVDTERQQLWSPADRGRVVQEDDGYEDRAMGETAMGISPNEALFGEAYCSETIIIQDKGICKGIYTQNMA